MNGIPMRFDYSKSINEQLNTFNYYKDRYCSYELMILQLRQDKENFKNFLKKIDLKDFTSNESYASLDQFREYILEQLERL